MAGRGAMLHLVSPSVSPLHPINAATHDFVSGLSPKKHGIAVRTVQIRYEGQTSKDRVFMLNGSRVRTTESIYLILSHPRPLSNRSFGRSPTFWNSSGEVEDRDRQFSPAS